MSMLMESDGTMMSFRQFCMSEAIKPKITSFGTDDSTSNQQTVEQSGYVLSFFKDELYYVAGVHKITGEVVFGASELYSQNVMDYTDDRTQTRNALSVFSKVMYVVTYLAQKMKLLYLRFDSANPALGKVYDRMVKNSIFLRSVEQSGYEYQGKFEDQHIFKLK